MQKDTFLLYSTLLFMFCSMIPTLHLRHSWQRGPNPPNFESPPIYCISSLLFFKFCPTPLPPSSLFLTSTLTVLFVILLLLLNGWLSHIWCVILVNDIMDQLVELWYLSARRALSYKYILTPPVMSSQQLSVLYWMNDLLIWKN